LVIQEAQMENSAENTKVSEFIKTLSNNTFSTPTTKKRIFIDKLFFGSRIYFLLRYIYITYIMSKLAKADKYHHDEFILH